ncbi:uncharacterized protein LOC117315018 [Pecten maximus]|uniref:uncharacterized protein LOC117315018 n=1 Tax=Pecten maximus TaxID=6579 RepID=UPI001458743F|nr:uncharacterized protein LOC117315018 [Pecten maximus]
METEDQTSTEKSPAKSASARKTRGSKGKVQEPDSPVAGSSKSQNETETAVIADFPTAPVLRTEKEKAAWEKYKDQFQTLCAALKNEGVDVKLVASSDQDVETKKKSTDKEISGDEDEDENVEKSDESENEEDENEEKSKEVRKRGRPPKTPAKTSESSGKNAEEASSKEVRKRGRPPKTPVKTQYVESDEKGDDENKEDEVEEKRGRGRPKKKPVEAATEGSDEKKDEPGVEEEEDVEGKRGRGRLKKKADPVITKDVEEKNDEPSIEESDEKDDTDAVDSLDKESQTPKALEKNTDTPKGTDTGVKRGRGRPPKTPKEAPEKSTENAEDSEKVEKRTSKKSANQEDGDDGKEKKKPVKSTPGRTPVPLVSSRSGRIRKTPARFLDAAVIEISDTEEAKDGESEDEDGSDEKPTKGNRGRPRKIFIKSEPKSDAYEKAAIISVKEKDEDGEQNDVDTPSRKRGRPPKQTSDTPGIPPKTDDKTTDSALKGKRGRPRKSITVEDGDSEINDSQSEKKKPILIKTEPKDDVGHSKRTARKKDNFPCEYCSKEFVLECLLERHTRSCIKKTSKQEKSDKDILDSAEGTEVISDTEKLPDTEKATDTSDMDCIVDEEVGESGKDEDELEEGEITKKRKREDDEEDCDPEEVKKPKISGDESDQKDGEPKKVMKSRLPKKRGRGRPRRQIYKQEYDDEDDDDFLPDTLKKARKDAMKKLTQTDLLYLQMNINDDEIECKICVKKFKDVKYLRRHMAIHAGIRDFICKICRKSFMRKYDLHIHMIRVHSWVKTGRGKIKTEDDLEEGEITLDTPKSKKLEKSFDDDDDDDVEEVPVENLEEERKFSCETCEKKFRFESSLKIHVQTHTDTKSFLCDLCGKGFSLEKYLSKHRLRHEKEGIIKMEGDVKVYNCQVCEKTFEVLPDYQTHMKSHKDENLRTFHCDQCPKGFFKLAHLKRHLLTHTTDRTYKCALCDKCYKDPDTLRKHQKCVHQVKDETTGEIMEKKAWPCDECGKVFFNSGHLKRHKFRHTGERPFPCATCGKSFTEKKSLENHTRIHTGDRPYHCEECGRRFIQMSHLRRHRYLHTQVRNFECPQCKKRFFENTDLMKHIRVHSNIRPFKCDLCHMSFAQKNVLVCHRRRHTGEKPFICDICSRAFTQLGSLQTHRRLHTGERPYKCQYCDQGFVSKERMKFHTFIHTGITPHICHICGKGFRLKFKLQSHIDSHEGVFRHKCQYCAKGFLERAKLNRHMKQVHNEDRTKNISMYGYKGNVLKLERDTNEENEGHQEIIIRNLGHFDGKENNTEEIIETTYVTIPSELTEGHDHETNNAISHITLDASEVSAATAANIGALFDGTTNSITIPQDSIVYEGEGGTVGEEVVYVVIPEENQTVILS